MQLFAVTWACVKALRVEERVLKVQQIHTAPVVCAVEGKAVDGGFSWIPCASR